MRQPRFVRNGALLNDSHQVLPGERWATPPHQEQHLEADETGGNDFYDGRVKLLRPRRDSSSTVLNDNTGGDRLRLMLHRAALFLGKFDGPTSIAQPQGRSPRLKFPVPTRVRFPCPRQYRCLCCRHHLQLGALCLNTLGVHTCADASCTHTVCEVPFTGLRFRNRPRCCIIPTTPAIPTRTESSKRGGAGRFFGSWKP